MNETTLTALLATAAAIGLVHTLSGPDHYLPFVAMSRAGRWSLRKTLGVTLACGVGHVLSSFVLGIIGIAIGTAVGTLEWLEDFRGELAGWLVLGFGLAYMAWGLRRARRNRPHSHWHAHADGTVHDHSHVHHAEHIHVHQAQVGASQESTTTTACCHGAEPDPQKPTGPLHGPMPPAARPRSMTPWLLFTIFVFGPCEPLIPLLMVPAAKTNRLGVLLVTLVFGIVTLAAMTAMVIGGCLGLSKVSFARAERYGHALAGAAITACGLAMKAGL